MTRDAVTVAKKMTALVGRPAAIAMCKRQIASNARRPQAREWYSRVLKIVEADK